MSAITCRPNRSLIASSRLCSVTPSDLARAATSANKTAAVMPSLSSGRPQTRYPSACSYPKTNCNSGLLNTVWPIHLNPVYVSANWTPYAAAIFDSSDDDTSVVMTSRSSPVVCRKM